MATLGIEELGCWGEVAIMGGGGGGWVRAAYDTCFFLQGVQQVFFTNFMLTVAYNGNPTIFNNIYG